MFCLITFEPIKIWTCSAPQNDRLNLSFVKDIHVGAKTMARNGRITAIYQLQILSISLYKFHCDFCIDDFVQNEDLALKLNNVDGSKDWISRILCYSAENLKV